MTPRQKRRDLSGNRDHYVDMASNREEAAGAAWEGADVERLILGENPQTQSLEDTRHWVAVYRHLVVLEQQLFDLLAKMIPNMPGEAQREAEQTNLPVLASQVERFRYRLDYWSKRQRELEKR